MEPTKWDAFSDELVHLSNDPDIKVVTKKKFHSDEGFAWDDVLEKTASSRYEEHQKRTGRMMAGVAALGGTAGALASPHLRKIMKESPKEALVGLAGGSVVNAGIGYLLGKHFTAPRTFRGNKNKKLEKTASSKLDAIKNTAKRVLKTPEGRGALIGGSLGAASGAGHEAKLRQTENGTLDAATHQKGRLKYIAAKGVAGAVGGAGLGMLGKHVGTEAGKGAANGVVDGIKERFTSKSKGKGPGVFERIKNTFKSKKNKGA
jgi:hypothetical protein